MKKFLKFGKKKNATPDTSMDASAGDLGNVSGYELREKDLSKIHKAAWTGDLGKIKSLAKKDASPLDKENRTPLHLACAKGHGAIVAELLEWKAKINLGDNAARTPLIKAVQCHQDDCVKLLLEHRADVNAVDKAGCSSLHYAAADNLYDIASMLVTTGAKIDIKNKEGRTPFHIAAAERQKDMCQLLLEEGANVNAQDNSMRTALMQACEDGDMGLVKLLLQFKADTSFKDSKGWTADDCAIMKGQHGCSQMIADYEVKNGRTPRQPSSGGKSSNKSTPVHQGAPAAASGFGAPALDAGEDDWSDNTASKMSAAAGGGGDDSWGDSEDDLPLDKNNKNKEPAPEFSDEDDEDSFVQPKKQIPKLNLSKLLKPSDDESETARSTNRSTKIPKLTDKGKGVKRSESGASVQRTSSNVSQQSKSRLPQPVKKVESTLSQQSVVSDLSFQSNEPSTWSDNDAPSPEPIKKSVAVTPAKKNNVPLQQESEVSDFDSTDDENDVLAAVTGGAGSTGTVKKVKPEPNKENQKEPLSSTLKSTGSITKDKQAKIMEELGMSDISEVSDPDLSVSSPRRTGRQDNSEWDSTLGSAHDDQQPDLKFSVVQKESDFDSTFDEEQESLDKFSQSEVRYPASAVPTTHLPVEISPVPPLHAASCSSYFLHHTPSVEAPLFNKGLPHPQTFVEEPLIVARHFASDDHLNKNPLCLDSEHANDKTSTSYIHYLYPQTIGDSRKSEAVVQRCSRASTPPDSDLLGFLTTPELSASESTREGLSMTERSNPSPSSSAKTSMTDVHEWSRHLLLPADPSSGEPSPCVGNLPTASLSTAGFLIHTPTLNMSGTGLRRGLSDDTTVVQPYSVPFARNDWTSRMNSGVSCSAQQLRYAQVVSPCSSDSEPVVPRKRLRIRRKLPLVNPEAMRLAKAKLGLTKLTPDGKPVAIRPLKRYKSESSAVGMLCSRPDNQFISPGSSLCTLSTADAYSVRPGGSECRDLRISVSTTCECETTSQVSPRSCHSCMDLVSHQFEDSSQTPPYNEEAAGQNVISDNSDVNKPIKLHAVDYVSQLCDRNIAESVAVTANLGNSGTSSSSARTVISAKPILLGDDSKDSSLGVAQVTTDRSIPKHGEDSTANKENSELEMVPLSGATDSSERDPIVPSAEGAVHIKAACSFDSLKTLWSQREMLSPSPVGACISSYGIVSTPGHIPNKVYMSEKGIFHKPVSQSPSVNPHLLLGSNSSDQIESVGLGNIGFGICEPSSENVQSSTRQLDYTPASESFERIPLIQTDNDESANIVQSPSVMAQYSVKTNAILHQSESTKSVPVNVQSKHVGSPLLPTSPGRDDWLHAQLFRLPKRKEQGMTSPGESGSCRMQSSDMLDSEVCSIIPARLLGGFSSSSCSFFTASDGSFEGSPAELEFETSNDAYPKKHDYYLEPLSSESARQDLDKRSKNFSLASSTELQNTPDWLNSWSKDQASTVGNERLGESGISSGVSQPYISMSECSDVCNTSRTHVVTHYRLNHEMTPVEPSVPSHCDFDKQKPDSMSEGGKQKVELTGDNAKDLSSSPSGERIWYNRLLSDYDSSSSTHAVKHSNLVEMDNADYCGGLLSREVPYSRLRMPSSYSMASSLEARSSADMLLSPSDVSAVHVTPDRKPQDSFVDGQLPSSHDNQSDDANEGQQQLSNNRFTNLSDDSMGCLVLGSTGPSSEDTRCDTSKDDCDACFQKLPVTDSTDADGDHSKFMWQDIDIGEIVAAVTPLLQPHTSCLLSPSEEDDTKSPKSASTERMSCIVSTAIVKACMNLQQQQSHLEGHSSLDSDCGNEMSEDVAKVVHSVLTVLNQNTQQSMSQLESQDCTERKASSGHALEAVSSEGGANSVSSPLLLSRIATVVNATLNSCNRVHISTPVASMNATVQPSQQPEQHSIYQHGDIPRDLTSAVSLSPSVVPLPSPPQSNVVFVAESPSNDDLPPPPAMELIEPNLIKSKSNISLPSPPWDILTQNAEYCETSTSGSSLPPQPQEHLNRLAEFPAMSSPSCNSLPSPPIELLNQKTDSLAMPSSSDSTLPPPPSDVGQTLENDIPFIKFSSINTLPSPPHDLLDGGTAIFSSSEGSLPSPPRDGQDRLPELAGSPVVRSLLDNNLPLPPSECLPEDNDILVLAPPSNVLMPSSPSPPQEPSISSTRRPLSDESLPSPPALLDELGTGPVEFSCKASLVSAESLGAKQVECYSSSDENLLESVSPSTPNGESLKQPKEIPPETMSPGNPLSSSCTKQDEKWAAPSQGVSSGLSQDVSQNLTALGKSTSSMSGLSDDVLNNLSRLGERVNISLQELGSDVSANLSILVVSAISNACLMAGLSPLRCPQDTDSPLLCVNADVTDAVSLTLSRIGEDLPLVKEKSQSPRKSESETCGLVTTSGKTLSSVKNRVQFFEQGLQNLNKGSYSSLNVSPNRSSPLSSSVSRLVTSAFRTLSSTSDSPLAREQMISEASVQLHRIITDVFSQNRCADDILIAAADILEQKSRTPSHDDDCRLLFVENKNHTSPMNLAIAKAGDSAHLGKQLNHLNSPDKSSELTPLEVGLLQGGNVLVSSILRRNLDSDASVVSSEETGQRNEPEVREPVDRMPLLEGAVPIDDNQDVATHVLTNSVVLTLSDNCPKKMFSVSQDNMDRIALTSVKADTVNKVEDKDSCKMGAINGGSALVTDLHISNSQNLSDVPVPASKLAIEDARKDKVFVVTDRLNCADGNFNGNVLVSYTDSSSSTTRGSKSTDKSKAEEKLNDDVLYHSEEAIQAITDANKTEDDPNSFPSPSYTYHSSPLASRSSVGGGTYTLNYSSSESPLCSLPFDVSSPLLHSSVGSPVKNAYSQDEKGICIDSGLHQSGNQRPLFKGEASGYPYFSEAICLIPSSTPGSVRSKQSLSFSPENFSSAHALLNDPIVSSGPASQEMALERSYDTGSFQSRSWESFSISLQPYPFEDSPAPSDSVWSGQPSSEQEDSSSGICKKSHVTPTHSGDVVNNEPTEQEPCTEKLFREFCLHKRSPSLTPESSPNHHQSHEKASVGVLSRSSDSLSPSHRWMTSPGNAQHSKKQVRFVDIHKAESPYDRSPNSCPDSPSPCVAGGLSLPDDDHFSALAGGQLPVTLQGNMRALSRGDGSLCTIQEEVEEDLLLEWLQDTYDREGIMSPDSLNEGDRQVYGNKPPVAPSIVKKFIVQENVKAFDSAGEEESGGSNENIPFKTTPVNSPASLLENLSNYSSTDVSAVRQNYEDESYTTPSPSLTKVSSDCLKATGSDVHATSGSSICLTDSSEQSTENDYCTASRSVNGVPSQSLSSSSLTRAVSGKDYYTVFLQNETISDDQSDGPSPQRLAYGSPFSSCSRASLVDGKLSGDTNDCPAQCSSQHSVESGRYVSSDEHVLSPSSEGSCEVLSDKALQLMEEGLYNHSDISGSPSSICPAPLYSLRPVSETESTATVVSTTSLVFHEDFDICSTLKPKNKNKPSGQNIDQPATPKQSVSDDDDEGENDKWDSDEEENENLAEAYSEALAQQPTLELALSPEPEPVTPKAEVVAENPSPVKEESEDWDSDVENALLPDESIPAEKDTDDWDSGDNDSFSGDNLELPLATSGNMSDGVGDPDVSGELLAEEQVKPEQELIGGGAKSKKAKSDEIGSDKESGESGWDDGSQGSAVLVQASATFTKPLDDGGNSETDNGAVAGIDKESGESDWDDRSQVSAVLVQASETFTKPKEDVGDMKSDGRAGDSWDSGDDSVAGVEQTKEETTSDNPEDEGLSNQGLECDDEEEDKIADAIPGCDTENQQSSPGSAKSNESEWDSDGEEPVAENIEADSQPELTNQPNNMADTATKKKEGESDEEVRNSRPLDVEIDESLEQNVLSDIVEEEASLLGKPSDKSNTKPQTPKVEKEEEDDDFWDSEDGESPLPITPRRDTQRGKSFLTAVSETETETESEWERDRKREQEKKKEIEMLRQREEESKQAEIRRKEQQKQKEEEEREKLRQQEEEERAERARKEEQQAKAREEERRRRQAEEDEERARAEEEESQRRSDEERQRKDRREQEKKAKEEERKKQEEERMKHWETEQKRQADILKQEAEEELKREQEELERLRRQEEEEERLEEERQVEERREKEKLQEENEKKAQQDKLRHDQLLKEKEGKAKKEREESERMRREAEERQAQESQLVEQIKREREEKERQIKEQAKKSEMDEQRWREEEQARKKKEESEKKKREDLERINNISDKEDDRSREIRLRRERAEKELKEARSRMARRTANSLEDSFSESDIGESLHDDYVGSRHGITNGTMNPDDDGLSYTSTENDEPREIYTSPTRDVRNQSFGLNDSIPGNNSEQTREIKRALEKERSMRTNLENKKKSWEKEKAELQRKLDNASQNRSQLEQNKLELEARIRNLDYTVNEEVEKRKNAEVLLQKTKQQLSRKEEQYTNEIESKQKSDLNLRNAQMELRNTQLAVKQFEEEKEEMMRLLQQEKNARLLQEQINEEQQRLQQTLNEEKSKSTNQQAEVINQLEEAGETRQLALDNLDKLRAELYQTKMELDRVKNRFKDENEVLAVENEEMMMKVEELKNDIKLNEEALAHATVHYNMQVNSAKNENSALAANQEKMKAALEKFEAEASSLQKRLSAATAELEKTSQARNELERTIQKQREDMTRSLEKKEEEVNRLKDSTQSLAQRLGAAEAKVNSLENEYHVANTALVERTTQCSNLQRELDQRRTGHETMDRDFRTEKERNAKIQAKMEVMQEKLQTLQHESLTLKQQLESARKDKDYQNRGSFESRDQMSTLMASMKNSDERTMITLQEKNSNLKDTISRINEDMRNAQSQKQSMEQELRHITQQLAEAQKKLSSTEASLEVYNRSKEQFEREKGAMQLESEKSLHKLQLVQEKLVESEGRIRELTSQLERAQRETLQAHQQIQSASKQSDGVEKAMSELEENCHKLEIEKTKVEAALKNETHKVESLRRELDDSHRSKANLQHLVENLKGSHSQLEERLGTETVNRTFYAQEADENKDAWETEVKARSKLGLRLAQLERAKNEAGSEVESEKRKARRALEMKKVLESKLEDAYNSKNALSNEVASLKAHLKAAKKRLKEVGGSESRVNQLYSEFDRERMALDGSMSAVRRQLDEVRGQLENELDKSERLQSENQTLKLELNTLKNMEKSFNKLEKSKRKLEDDLSSYKSYVNTNYVERGEIQRLQHGMETSARQELNRKLEEVNSYLEDQTKARDNLDQVRLNNEMAMKSDFENTRKELMDEVSSLRKTYSESLAKKESVDAEAQKFRDLYENEAKLRGRLVEKLTKASDKNAAATLELSFERQRNLLLGAGAAPQWLHPSSTPLSKPMNHGLNDSLSHKLTKELDRSIAKHLESGPRVDISPIRKTKDDSFLTSHSSKPWESHHSALKRKYFV